MFPFKVIKISKIYFNFFDKKDPSYNFEKVQNKYLLCWRYS